MATDLSWTEPETGAVLKPGHVDLWIYEPRLIPSLEIITDPTRCDLSEDDPEDLAFLKSLVATGGNIEPLLARRDPITKKVRVFEGRRRLGGTRTINANPEYWSQFVPAREPGFPPIPPPPLPLQVRIMKVSEEEALRLAWHGNNHKGLGVMDMAFCASQFRERLGWEPSRVASEMGISPSHVSFLLQLPEMPLRFRLALHKKKIKASMAQALLGRPEEIDVTLDRLDRGEDPREIMLDLKEKKRAAKAKEGGKLSRNLAELKKDLERIAAGKNIAAANRAGQLLDYLAGNESQSIAVTLAKDDDTPRALPVPTPVAVRGTDVAILEGEERP